MKKIEHPAKGGSYTRDENGKLEPQATQQEPAPAKPAAKKKGAK